MLHAAIREEGGWTCYLAKMPRGARQEKCRNEAQ
jgi:hypothetical protein